MTIKATVYRIECATTGDGMHRTARTSIESCDSFCAEPRAHPLPTDDTKLHDQLVERELANTWCLYDDAHVYSFGFADLGQLRNWLYKDEWLLWLHNNGFILAICESEDVMCGNTQAMFIKANEYQKVSIKEFFNL